jgi:hypothetical protein
MVIHSKCIVISIAPNSLGRKSSKSQNLIAPPAMCFAVSRTSDLLMLGTDKSNNMGRSIEITKLICTPLLCASRSRKIRIC